MLLELVKFFVVKLVDKPALVSVKQVELENKSVIEIRVAPQDLSRVIGKEGRTFKSIKSLINGVSTSESYKDVVVDIV